MFCTGDIVTVDYCMEIYRQFLNRETFDFLIVGIWEIREALHKIHQKIINQLLYDFKKCDSKSNQKLKLCAMKFCVETWQNMSHKVKEQLVNIAQNFFLLLEQFAKLKETECMNILILENNVESITGSSCGEFQLYFYKNLFDPNEKVKF